MCVVRNTNRRITLLLFLFVRSVRATNYELARRFTFWFYTYKLLKAMFK